MAEDVPEQHNLRDKMSWAWVALVVGLTVIVYLPSLGGGFLLDDDALLIGNELIRAPDGLRRFWLTTEPDDYWPLSATTLWMEWRLWGMNPTGYRITNLALHIASALLVWAVLRQLLIPGARLAALIFAVHPVNVESVAWIAQRKDMLALVFLLISILWFIKADWHSPPKGFALHRPGKGIWYWLSLTAFVLGMLSKSSVATLPLLLLLIIWWRRRLSWQDVVRVLPYFAVSAALVLVHVWVQGLVGAEPIRNASFADRLVGAGAALFFYLYKALVPINLLFIYPMWTVDAGQFRWWAPLATAVAITVLLWFYRNRWGRPLFFAWGWFCISLLPVLGFVDVGFMRHSLVADHYQHIAIIGVIALVAGALTSWGQEIELPNGRQVVAEGIVVVGLLTVLSFRQAELYASPLLLYGATLEGNPGSRAAHNNLGVALVELGRFDEAIAHHQAALRIDPSFSQTHINLAVALSSAGRYGEAISHYSIALERDPSNAVAKHNLASALAQVGRTDEAIAQYEAALQIKPLIATHMNLASLLAQSGRMDETIDHFRAALSMSPNNPVIHDALGSALATSGQVDDAIAHFQESLRIDPLNAEVKRKLALLQGKAQQEGQTFDPSRPQ